MEHVCTICGKPALPEQGIYSISGNHWDCETAGEKFLRSEIKTSNILLSDKPRASAGKGKTAQRIEKMIREAFAIQYPGDAIEDFLIWVQPPYYRGPRWDLAVWGGHAYVGKLLVSFHSWATMTQCVKSGSIKLSMEGPHDWDILPGIEI